MDWPPSRHGRKQKHRPWVRFGTSTQDPGLHHDKKDNDPAEPPIRPHSRWTHGQASITPFQHTQRPDTHAKPPPPAQEHRPLDGRNLAPVRSEARPYLNSSRTWGRRGGRGRGKERGKEMVRFFHHLRPFAFRRGSRLACSRPRQPACLGDPGIPGETRQGSLHAGKRLIGANGRLAWEWFMLCEICCLGAWFMVERVAAR